MNDDYCCWADMNCVRWWFKSIMHVFIWSKNFARHMTIALQIPIQYENLMKICDDRNDLYGIHCVNSINDTLYRSSIFDPIFTLNYTEEHLHCLLVNSIWYVLICIWPFHNIYFFNEKTLTELTNMLNWIFKRKTKPIDGFALVPIN